MRINLIFYSKLFSMYCTNNATLFFVKKALKKEENIQILNIKRFSVESN